MMNKATITTEDFIQGIGKPSIFKAKCKECNAVYIGQTRKEIQTRAKEHLAYIGNNIPV